MSAPDDLPPVWAACRMLAAAVADPATTPADRDIALAMLRAGHVARLPHLRGAVENLAEAVADTSADAELRRMAWRALSEESRPHRAAGRDLGRWAADVLAIAGGRVDRGAA